MTYAHPLVHSRAENGLRFCLVARFTHFERSAQRDRALDGRTEQARGFVRTSKVQTGYGLRTRPRGLC
jgi:hypothetical protein